MKTNIVILISIIFFSSCRENKKKPVEDDEVSNFKKAPILIDPIAYVSNPATTDTLCITEINRAKNDIRKKGIVFTQGAGFGFGFKRYEEELIGLCKEKGLKFEKDLIDCVNYEGQTQGCYGAYMDKILAEKYGQDFKEKMHKKADSLFLQNVIRNNTAVEYWDCDERPRLPFEKERSSDEIPELKVNIDIKENLDQNGGWPFFDLGFIIEKDSTISNFYIRNFVPELETNKKYKNELFALASKHMKKNYGTWVPGIIKGKQVRTNNNVRIFLVKE